MRRGALIAAGCLLAARAFAGGSITARKAALSTDHPLATRTGLAIMQSGGNAADAAVAVALALAVVQPQSGNLGGGGFATYYDAQTRGVWTLDFRETAPRGATKDTRSGAAAAGVPGTLAGLHALHERFGSRPWKGLVEPALLLARDGARADTELAAAIAAARETRKLELPDVLPPPQLATTLQRIAEHGARDFYSGDVAKKLVADLHAANGVVGYRDLREYQPIWRAPFKLRYGPYDIYSVAPPSGGGLVIGEILNILAGDDLAALGYQSTPALYLLVEAQRRAYIDRNRHLGDPANTRIPYFELLSQKRGEQWRNTIGDRVVGTVALGEPRELVAEGEHTTHFTIADTSGNVVTVTTTLGDDFGSGFLSPSLGFFLNSANADFSISPNAVEPGKRAATSLAPTIVLRGGKPFLAIGSSGGTAIPTTILQVFLNVAAYGKSLPEAVAAPRYHHAATPDELLVETNRAPQATIDALNAKGHAITFRASIGDVHAILFEKDRMIAVADPRRGGAAGGF